MSRLKHESINKRKFLFSTVSNPHGRKLYNDHDENFLHFSKNIYLLMDPIIFPYRLRFNWLSIRKIQLKDDTEKYIIKFV